MDLQSPVTALPMVGPAYGRRLEKLGIKIINDLLHHIPHKYLDLSLTSPISRVQPGEMLTIRGEITSMKNQYTRSGMKIQIAEVRDSTGQITVVWFNQPYLIKNLYEGVRVALAGKVDWYGRKKAFISPEWEKITMGQKGIHTGGIIPVYPETAGISSKWLRRRIHDAYNLVKLQLSEFLPRETLKVNSLLNFDDAISKVHFPKNTSKTGVGLKRLAFNELLFLQMQSLKRKRQWQKNKVAAKLKVDSTSMNQFIEVLPFKLTASQEKAIGEILVDLKRDYPMNRLLEGDVGSGKTVVAATGAFLSFTNGYQTVFMVPTQILAQQHYETLKKLLQSFSGKAESGFARKVHISLVTSQTKVKDIGRTDIFIGTHALIHNKVGFDQVALVVIDEQHRFGVEQRAHLTKIVGGKKSAPHVLTMTATPIPRTIALTFYGDLDLSTLNEIPAGRQKITTWIVPPEKREGAYQWIKSQITSTKSQIFVVCPLIEESDKETLAAVKAATGHYEDLKKVFKDLNIGLLHGRMKVKEKNKVLGNFRSRRIDILVATPVVEVGIDVPNATIMVIEASERFGLAQLHQLRGRVGRGEKKSYCLLFSESKSPKAFSRLSAMTKTISGFELAEMDLRLRGPGEIFGVAQHGFPELKIAKWTDIELIKKARQVATCAFDNPTNFPDLFKKLSDMQKAAN